MSLGFTKISITDPELGSSKVDTVLRTLHAFLCVSHCCFPSPLHSMCSLPSRSDMHYGSGFKSFGKEHKPLALWFNYIMSQSYWQERQHCSPVSCVQGESCFCYGVWGVIDKAAIYTYASSQYFTSQKTIRKSRFKFTFNWTQNTGSFFNTRFIIKTNVCWR